MRRARTSTLRNPNSTKGIPSVIPRDKGYTCAPGAERTSVLWRMSGCTIGSSAAWQERGGLQRADHPHNAPAVWSRSALTVWRAVKPCCHAMQACRCVDNTRETPPRLRACANYHTHLPVIKRPPRQQLLGYQVGDADDETTLQRGALDVAAKFMKLTFRRGVLVRRQQRRRPTSPANTLRRLRTRFAGVTELPPPPGYHKERRDEHV